MDRKAREVMPFYWDVPVPPELKAKAVNHDAHRLLVKSPENQFTCVEIFWLEGLQSFQATEIRTGAARNRLFAKTTFEGNEIHSFVVNFF
jgi:hypothetical protein